MSSSDPAKNELLVASPLAVASYGALRPLSRTAWAISMLTDAVYKGAWLGLLDRASLYAVGNDFYRGNRRSGFDVDRNAYMSEEWNLRRGLKPWEQAS